MSDGDPLSRLRCGCVNAATDAETGDVETGADSGGCDAVASGAVNSSEMTGPVEAGRAGMPP